MHAMTCDACLGGTYNIFFVAIDGGSQYAGAGPQVAKHNVQDTKRLQVYMICHSYLCTIKATCHINYGSRRYIENEHYTTVSRMLY